MYLLYISYKYFHDHYSDKLIGQILSVKTLKKIHSSSHVHYSSVKLPVSQMSYSINLFPWTASLWDLKPLSYFPLVHDIQSQAFG